MRHGRSAALAAVLVGMLGMSAVSAAPAVEAAPDRLAQVRELTKKAAEITKAYRGQLQNLEDAKRAARRATTRARRLERSLATASRQAGYYARVSYMIGGMDGARFLSGGDLNQIATLTHLATERSQRLKRVSELAAAARKAQQAADKEIARLRKDIKELEAKRDEVAKLLAKFGFQTPDRGTGLTPRMIAVRNAIMAAFPMPYGVGCLRRGDAGEHGVGRACDFMMSPGGVLPTPANRALGDAIAAWLIKNGKKLGVKYVIWRQRIYNMAAPGWRVMSDRGSITQNHYDHVHVSMY